MDLARAVYRGEEIHDDRLAGAVIEYAGVVRQAQERDARVLASAHRAELAARSRRSAAG